MVRQLAYWLALAAACGAILASVGRGEVRAGDAAEAADFWFAEADGAVAWCSDASTLGEWESDRPEEEAFDSALQPSQFLTPSLQNPAARQPVRLSPSTPRPALRAAAVTGLASIPYMIGDTGAGTCLGFSGLLDATLSHPTLACGRLNIAEANSPLPVDRVYYSYRHFHNTSMISAYQFGETLDVDRHNIAWENTFWDRTGSLELRLPLEQRLRSDIFSILAPNFGVVDPLVAPGDGRQLELGNVSAIFKMLLVEREAFALSSGVGVTLPTAQDVDYQLAVDGIVEYPSTPGLTADMAAAYHMIFANETVYISPFTAWLYAPRARWFHQGFLQVEVAANPSRVTVDGDGAALFLDNGVPIGFYDFFTPTAVRADLFAQTLMRLNLGVGYRLADNPQAAWFRQLTGLLEMHYTTTLQDANLSDIPLTTQSSVGTVPLQTIAVGNKDNRVDIVNAAAGVSGQLGNWIVTNGFVAPVRKAPDRGFDFEYNLQVQRPF